MIDIAGWANILRQMEITHLGDSALIVQVREQFEDAPEEALDKVLRTFERLRSAHIPGVIELAPAYTTVAIFFDPLQVATSGAKQGHIFDWLVAKVRAAVAGGADPGGLKERPKKKARLVEIPVCYDRELAPDLDHVAQHAHMSSKNVVDLHSAAEYRVNCIGFTPGFPFLSGMPKELATPRQATPRKDIPPGSVGIGGAQTGIYPLRSPGGWNLIGRAALPLFDPKKNPPTLLRAGDRVRFRPITREEFESLNVKR